LTLENTGFDAKIHALDLIEILSARLSNDQCFAIFSQQFSIKHFISTLFPLYTKLSTNEIPISYYEKIGYRVAITRILQTALNIDPIQKSLTEYSKKPEIEQFINTLLGDISWAYDEALLKLAEIHKLEQSKLPPHEINELYEKCENLFPMLYNSLPVLMELCNSD